MNAHSNAKLTPLSRAELVRRIVELHPPVAEVAARFGIFVRSAQKWLVRFRAEGTAGLENRPSRPKRSPERGMLERADGKRNGLSSAMGIDFDHAHADLEFQGVPFKYAAVR